jgi:dTDP-4-amino-4,6-dideoxygalactose transaminase
MINIFSNTIGQEELDAVSKIFKSQWLGSGKQCDLFEKEFAEHLKVPEILLFNNCTSAIYVSHRALNIKPGDEVIISTSNFVACANVIIDCGATPVFADIDPVTLNILPSEIDRLKTKKTKAISILHYGGHPADFDEIKNAAGENVLIIEDSANSVSSSYKGRMCGSLGDAGYFSFDAMKILVMADGGALYLKDKELIEEAKVFRYLGLAPKTTSGIDSLKEKHSKWWEFELADTAGRFISNDVLAAIGRIQLKKINSFISRRKEIWEYYQKELKNIDEIICPPEPLKGCTSSYYLYWIKTPKRRDELASYLVENDVYTTFRYFPLHLVKHYNSRVSLPNSEIINETTLNIPLHQNLTDNEVDKIVSLVKKFFSK